MHRLFGENLPQVEEELSDISNLPQVGAEIYAIPWGHIKVIVDKCKGNPEKAISNFKTTLPAYTGELEHI